MTTSARATDKRGVPAEFDAVHRYAPRQLRDYYYTALDAITAPEKALARWALG